MKWHAGIILFALWLFCSQVFAAEEPTPLSLSDTVTLLVKKSPLVKAIQKEITIAKGRSIAAEGAFDPLLHMQGGPKTDPSYQADNVYEIFSTVSLSQRTRFSLQWELGLQSTIDAKDLSKDNQAQTAYVNFQFPLFKHSSGDISIAEETAAKLELQAAKLSVRHQMATALKNMVIAYWRWAADYEKLTITEFQENRAKELLANIELLIQNNELPKAEKPLYQANLMQATAARLELQQQLQNSLSELFLLIGVASVKKAYLPENELPNISFPVVDLEATTTLMVKQALASRSDYGYRFQLCRAAKVRKYAYQVEKRHDLSVYLNLQGMYAGAQQAIALQESQADQLTYAGDVGLIYQWPIGNHQAVGHYLEHQATYNQCTLQLEALREEIKTTIRNQLSAIYRTALRSKQRKKAVTYYRQALMNEQEKFRLGMGTTIDILTTEERYILSKKEMIENQLDRAVALAELRFVRGDLDELVDANKWKMNVVLQPPQVKGGS